MHSLESARSSDFSSVSAPHTVAPWIRYEFVRERKSIEEALSSISPVVPQVVHLVSIKYFFSVLARVKVYVDRPHPLQRIVLAECEQRIKGFLLVVVGINFPGFPVVDNCFCRRYFSDSSRISFCFFWTLEDLEVEDAFDPDVSGGFIPVP